VRFALGAPRTHVGWLVLRRVGLLAGVGVALGAALGLGLGSLMSSILFGVEPSDPTALLAAMAAIGLTALFASLAPLRHAMAVSPAETLSAD
jgi:ABC-type antimicrobial peptide transport system permease subunit